MIPTGAAGNDAIRPFNTETDVKNALEMLYNLSTLEVAAKVLLGARHRISEINPYDYILRAMDISMDVLSEKSLEYTTILDYFKNTRNDTHYGIDRIFKIQRKGEPERMEKWKHLENHYLLWHGSRTSNFIGILAQGLRIAPPEAPCSGYAFGKGIYFADMCKKSLNYTSVQTGYIYSSVNLKHGFLLLCEVALGNIYETHNIQYMEKPPEGYNSTLGKGHTGPDWSTAIVLPNGVKVPYRNSVVPSIGAMANNEYIVYDVSQVRMRYLLEVKYDYAKYF